MSRLSSSADLIDHADAGMISSNLELHRYATGRESRVVTAMTLLKSHLFRQAAHAMSYLAQSFHRPSHALTSV